jgi:serine/threonine protein kinase
VHGDLKTLNALYIEAGSLYKWCDFGFSKKINEVQSLASQSASIAAETGTLFWMAPELLTMEVHTRALILVDCPPLVLLTLLFSGGAV